MSSITGDIASVIQFVDIREPKLDPDAPYPLERNVISALSLEIVLDFSTPSSYAYTTPYFYT